ncbi:hypothetical protein TWF569_011557 [Orbilia oligospora]|uniref:DUF1996 domain-containing protein n=1 Tax=Orbilia oligospora TaxID=2813651 RepID=A0A7C8P7R0_ORBOL|nr:hypothetical protein TWF103_002512 [Orbilia oligospora]KAF3094694.1 hypothetical protein TWF102_007486 [Orbilia oligospora]KAF3113019.1 hypothetical protein TWF706_010028 [Orbilia oligospora]KAF3130665.1 hypothetical protein TWF569_011557 [Orbilia oligospora]KAF3133121.1 hypothetical protein TWF594_009335 [Orbilia oligospora]
MKTVLSLAAFLLLNPGVDAFWRMQCGSPLVTDMIDPLVQPGVSPAKHVHNIMGGDAFDKTTSWARLQESTCTSCEVKGDKSIYWVPTLYFQKASGELVQVRQKDGMLVYYIPERGGDAVETYPKNFGMMAGDPKLRSFDESNEPGSEAYMRQMAIGFNCLNYGGTPEAFAARREMPTKQEMKNCVNGLRADITFPSCWNGELDSEDHRSHMAYPSFMEDGTCPDSHPRRLITMKFETLFDVAEFSDVDGEFVWATGDKGGHGYHGDFYNGWDPELLEAAYKDPTCVPPVITSTGGDITQCNTFTSRNELQGPNEMNACKIKPITGKEYEGPFESLPGCNPVGGAPGDCGKAVVVENAVAAPSSSAIQVVAHAVQKTSSTTSSTTPTPTPTPTTISTTTRKKETSKKVEVASVPVPKPVVTANPVLDVGSVPEKKIKEVIVTVVETVYQTVYNQAVETATEYVPHHARHRRFFRRGARHF